ncbi:pre-rRNA-processing protein TSR2 [Geosmithia morbida]|uniref:Pre-rRNA-processing protein TSR2 n=1 Tax=Geosmithia morbida TaxID=1094350 RepID=A0A9P5D415_9HYPO|nr:pre-rRNA-processing protein TSR2 [Geosmithia morbida]KAF4125567.1 pre-rRNA-processing protein TSR2 [Geosmithia morbida]
MATSVAPEALPPAGTYNVYTARAEEEDDELEEGKRRLANPRMPIADRQYNFEQAVAYAINLWPDLNLAVQNNWGGPDSADKRDFLVGAIVDLFAEYTDAPPDPKKKTVEEPNVEDVETVLLQYIMEEFEVNIDDDSSVDVASQIIRARAQCTEGKTEELDVLRERYNNRKGKGTENFKRVEDAEQDTDWETDDDDDDDDDDDEGGADVNMDEAPQLVRQPKPEPEVDEDGFTKVTKKR